MKSIILLNNDNNYFYFKFLCLIEFIYYIIQLNIIKIEDKKLEFENN